MNIITKIVALLIVLSMFVGLATACASDYRTRTDQTTQTIPFTKESMSMVIEFRPNVTSTIDVVIYKNSNVNKCDINNRGKIGYALAGFAHNGVSYEHLITQIFSESKDVSMMIVPDLPGHGNSSMPTNMLFSDLTLNDYANINKLILEKLNEKGIQPNFGIFHSQSGLVAMMTQDQVNLKTYGIKDVILIASAPPQQVNWSFLSTVNPYTFLQYLTIDNNGMYFVLPPTDWIGFFFTNPDGTISQNLPSMENIDRYNAKIPFASTAQLIGINVISLSPPVLELNNSIRPSVSKGIFSKNSPTLWIISNGNDTIISKDDVIRTYNYLTSKNNNIIFFPDNEIVMTNDGMKMTDEFRINDKFKIKKDNHIIYIPNAVHDNHLVMNIEELNKII